MVGETRIRQKLAAQANTIVAVFIFLFAATAGQVDVEDAALRPKVLITEVLGRRSSRYPPPPEGLDIAAHRPLVGAAPNHREEGAPAPLLITTARIHPSPRHGDVVLAVPSRFFWGGGGEL
jgi:hypothetical protein